jgi:hypothetical protein
MVIVVDRLARVRGFGAVSDMSVAERAQTAAQRPCLGATTASRRGL